MSVGGKVGRAVAVGMSPKGDDGVGDGGAVGDAIGCVVTVGAVGDGVVCKAGVAGEAQPINKQRQTNK
jgi:hypothetical protein